MDFTKEELYLIERTMDNLQAGHLKGIMQYINTVDRIGNKEAKDLIQKEIKGWVETHDKIKTICAKCEELRTEVSADSSH